MLQSDLCDYINTYIVVKEIITVQTENNSVIDEYDKNLILKDNAPFSSCISKINNVLTDNVEDLDIVMPMYNLIECLKSYSKTSGTSWNYYKAISTNPIINCESFKYKASITEENS